MFNGSLQSSKDYSGDLEVNNEIQAVMANSETLIGIDDVQKSLNRSRASVYRYTNTDARNINPAFNPRKLNPEYRTDQKDPLLFHPNEVARFAKDILRIKEVTVEILNSPSSETQNTLKAILEELKIIRNKLDTQSDKNHSIPNHLQDTERKAA